MSSSVVPSRPRWRPLVALGALSLVVASSSCGDDEVTVTPTAKLGPGEICSTPNPMSVRAYFQPAQLVLAPGQRRTARLVVDPDFCVPTPVSFTSSTEAVAAPPPSGQIDYAAPTIDIDIEGGAEGDGTITALVPRGDGEVVEAVLRVNVRSAAVTACAQGDALPATTLTAGAELAGAGTLAQARIALPAGADKPNDGSYLWSVGPFDVAIDCAADIVPAGHLALGAAVTFGPSERVFPRDMPLAIPINPAAMPTAARWRHLHVAYSGPRFVAPRVIAVADPRLERDGDRWMLRFSAPRLGTYQAVIKTNAGTVTHTRRITHRAVIGISMGGAGTAQFGLRHHDLFDVIAPLGGPVDWTWMSYQIETQHTGGFRPIAPGTKLEDIGPLERKTCTTNAACATDETCLGVLNNPPTAGKCTFLSIPDEPYYHTQTFNTWWYEYPRNGNGGRFDRNQYLKIFRDLALMFGNPNGYNPDALNLPTGVDPNHKSQTGDHTNGECKVWVDPLEGPNQAAQQAIASSCPAERCSHTQTLTNYYDDEYNPDGTFPVITFCDGGPQNEALTPYANTWTVDGNNSPMEVALAVDYNGNGVRDELEPVIRSGHEPWDDWGTDMTPSMMEPGYNVTNNLDPSGDDYEPQYNPTGTEGDHRFQTGEAYRDYGLDGVMGTSGSIYDYGEGDGSFTVAPGLQRFWDYDAHSIVRNWPSAAVKPLDDDALARIDFWTDGGTRDLFNFLVAAR
ncbi:MAG TPA: hypothetical protein ENK23_02660, partial [Sorangium sp.]|nr:hypothetical protein [Sorangium sp.]